MSACQRLRAAFALVLVLGLVGCSTGDQDELWIIGLDGADWDILDPLIANGDLPNLAALRRSGTWGELRSDEPMLSPILWTSIATGKTADLHGVTWFMSDAPDGTKIPVSSRNRWVRTVWNIANEAGLESGVVGWWATWPAEPIKGFLVSDYVAWHSFGVTGRELDAPGKTHPPELYEDTADLFPSPESIDDDLMATFVHLPPEQLRFDPAAEPHGEPISHLRQAIATTLGYTALTLEQLERDRPQLLALYYEGTDAVEHLFTSYASPRLEWISEADHAAFKDVVSEYWKWQDQQLGRLLEARGPNTTIMIISDHGFRTGPERLRELEFSIERADASHMLDGVVILNGPGIRKNHRIDGATIYDVTPTALRLLGLPVANDMKGQSLEPAFAEEWVATHPQSRVDTYETGPWDRGDEMVVDDAAGERMEDMLRSLGYLGGGGDDDTGGGEVSNVEQVVNMAIVLRQQGKADEAATRLEEVLVDHPDDLSVKTNLARVYADLGRHEDSEAIYAGLVKQQPTNLEYREDFAMALARSGKVQDALEQYEAGLDQQADWHIGLAGKGFALHQMGRSDEAIVILDDAVGKDPRLAEAHYYRGVVQRALSRTSDARQSLERAMQLDPSNAPAAVQLAILREEAGDIAGGIQLLQSVKSQAHGDPNVGAQLGAMFLKANRLPEAVAELREVVEVLNDPIVYGNYGTALGMSGDLPAAAKNFEKVVELDPNSREGLTTLAQIHMQLQNPQRAESILRGAVERIPDDPFLRLNLGTLYHGLGRLDDAQREYETAIEMDDTVGIFHYQLAMLFGQRGDETKARELVKKARELDPSLPEPGGG